jgi:hypothetical protein
MLIGHWPNAEHDPAAAQLPEARYRVEHAGRRLAGTFACVYAGTKGDLKWMMHAYQFTRNWMCNDMCWDCLGSKVNLQLLYTSVDEHSGWALTEGRYANSASPLKRLTGWHMHTVWKDLMHLLFVNGVGNDLCGSILLEMSSAGVWAGAGSSLENNLNAAFGKFIQWVNQSGLESSAEGFNKNVLHYSSQKSYPHLGGKAADVRLVLMWLAQEMTSVPGQWLLEFHCTAALANYVYNTSSWDVLLTDQQCATLRECGMSFVRDYLALAAQHVEQGICLYKIRPKIHYFMHLIRQTTKLNPKVCSCWANEDYMGRIARVASRTHPSTTSLRVLQRFVFQLAREIRTCRAGTSAGLVVVVGFVVASFAFAAYQVILLVWWNMQCCSFCNKARGHVLALVRLAKGMSMNMVMRALCAR